MRGGRADRQARRVQGVCGAENGGRGVRWNGGRKDAGSFGNLAWGIFVVYLFAGVANIRGMQF